MEQVLIERLREITPKLDAPFVSEPSKSEGSRFAEMVSGLIGEVNEKQNTASANADGLAKGEVGIMDTVVSLNEADLSLRMIMQVRDRAIDSYQRILRTI